VRLDLLGTVTPNAFVTLAWESKETIFCAILARLGRETLEQYAKERRAFVRRPAEQRMDRKRWFRPSSQCCTVLFAIFAPQRTNETSCTYSFCRLTGLRTRIGPSFSKLCSRTSASSASRARWPSTTSFRSAVRASSRYTTCSPWLIRCAPRALIRKSGCGAPARVCQCARL
jgi:hypothetical protein